jgi:hypothetical protein
MSAHIPANMAQLRPGKERNSDDPPNSETQKHSIPDVTTSTEPKQPTMQRIQPKDPNIPRPAPVTSDTPKTISSELSTLKLLERFEPEARVLAPVIVDPHFNAQSIYTQLYNFYKWRFFDIAHTNDSSVAYIAQVENCARRVALICLNTITNKLIIANRTEGWPIDALANPIGPPKGYTYPSLSATVIATVGKTSPEWSGDTFFVPRLNNVIPQLNDPDGNAIQNIHQYVGDPLRDQMIARFCKTGNIPMRSTDWKIPGGSPHWLPVVVRNNGRVECLVKANVHPDNFDPAGTVLSSVATCTNLAVNQTLYIIMKQVSEEVVFGLLSTAYEK